MDNEPLRSAGKPELTIGELFIRLQQLAAAQRGRTEPLSPSQLASVKNTVDWIVAGIRSNGSYYDDAVMLMYDYLLKISKIVKRNRGETCWLEIQSLANASATKICQYTKDHEFSEPLHFVRFCFLVTNRVNIDEFRNNDNAIIYNGDICKEAADEEEPARKEDEAPVDRGVPAELLAELLAELPEELRLEEGDIEIILKSAPDRDLAERFHTTEGAVRARRHRIPARLGRIRAWLEKNRPEMYKKFRTALGLKD
jgi:DNA-directed RNA polymerase specialized sigma24 family protein